MRSNFFEVGLRNHSFFVESKARKDIIKIILEMKFNEDNNQKIKRYFWMLLERIRKIIS